MLMSKRKERDIDDGMNHNTSVRFKANEISNQSIHTSWNPQPGVKINDVMKGKVITSM